MCPIPSNVFDFQFRKLILYKHAVLSENAAMTAAFLLLLFRSNTNVAFKKLLVSEPDALRVIACEKLLQAFHFGVQIVGHAQRKRFGNCGLLRRSEGQLAVVRQDAVTKL